LIWKFSIGTEPAWVERRFCADRQLLQSQFGLKFDMDLAGQTVATGRNNSCSLNSVFQQHLKVHQKLTTSKIALAFFLRTNTSVLVRRNVFQHCRFLATTWIRQAVVGLLLVIALNLTGCSLSEPIKPGTPVRIGDIVLKIPSEFNPNFVVRKPGLGFNYARLQSVPVDGLEKADDVFIELKYLWRNPEELSYDVIHIEANERSVPIDFFCRSPNRIGKQVNPRNSIGSDGEFYIYKEKNNVVYIAKKDLSLFGSPLTAWVSNEPIVNPGASSLTYVYEFRIALSANTNLSLRIRTFQIPQANFRPLFAEIERVVKSWIIQPPLQTFRWFHDQEINC
jgi:hypothetical protein